ncbi:hypothetical protein AB0K51_33335 [Kitasatospora sp. NPDC049285]|uniref:hypothetical protein n=1 Tax=Kitasatospora sp. NPDC049285 TaxID=3157096 RepID=UPI00341D0E8D
MSTTSHTTSEAHIAKNSARSDLNALSEANVVLNVLFEGGQGLRGESGPGVGDRRAEVFRARRDSRTVGDLLFERPLGALTRVFLARSDAEDAQAVITAKSVNCWIEELPISF